MVLSVLAMRSLSQQHSSRVHKEWEQETPANTKTYEIRRTQHTQNTQHKHTTHTHTKHTQHTQHTQHTTHKFF